MSDTIKCTIRDSDKFIFPILEEKIYSISSLEDIIKCTIEEKELLNIFFLEKEIIRVIVEGGGGGTAVIDWSLLDTYIIQEDLTLAIDGIKTDFSTNYNFYTNSLKVYINGLKEKIIEILNDSSFRVIPVLEIGDYLEVEYIKKI